MGYYDLRCTQKANGGAAKTYRKKAERKAKRDANKAAKVMPRKKR